jgi:hypothetical protein
VLATAGTAVDEARKMADTIIGAHMALGIVLFICHLEVDSLVVADVITSGTLLPRVEVAATQVTTADLSNPVLGLINVGTTAPALAVAVASSRDKAGVGEYCSQG